MKTIRQLLKGKKRNVWKIAPEAHVFDALKIMAEKDIGALLVVEGKSLVGVFSERDYARKVILLGRSSKETRISEIIKGNRRITADTAIRLSNYFGNSVKFWLGLQDDYDIEEELNKKGPDFGAIKRRKVNAA